MPVAVNRTALVNRAEPTGTPVWMHLVGLAAAGLFVSILAMTYGLDLSPGFF